MQAPQIRPCLFVLRTEVARNEYNTIALALIQVDRLTMHTHRVLSSYATQVDAIAIALKRGEHCGHHGSLRWIELVAS
jgi:hypothetical protein